MRDCCIIKASLIMARFSNAHKCNLDATRKHSPGEQAHAVATACTVAP